MDKSRNKIKAEIIAGLILIIGFIVCYVLVTQFHHEKMTFDEMYNVKVSVRKEKQSDAESSYTEYYVKFAGVDKKFDLTLSSKEGYYYDYFKQFTDKDSISVPVFKMENGEFFVPLTTEKCSEKKASEDYGDYFYNVKYIFPLYTLGVALGGVLLIGGLKSLHSSKNNQRIQTVETGIWDDSENIHGDASEYQKNDSDLDAAKDFLDEQIGTRIYKKTKARFYVEENPLRTDYPRRDLYTGSLLFTDHKARRQAQADIRNAKKEIFSEKFGGFSHEKKGIGDILMHDKNKNKKH